ncbi:hypothetical protein K1T71_000043 [Dendrolimus kikuchii]|uniref:Uncharacterized protein n=1 Tax=Dendrolimus kikuchii TaxID=765133 RepID=A0ACC1DID3_9NEOP|nr:hypothetical protein K1T71_000043 [Dendrolimus kikuchii]
MAQTRAGLLRYEMRPLKKRLRYCDKRQYNYFQPLEDELIVEWAINNPKRRWRALAMKLETITGIARTPNSLSRRYLRVLLPSGRGFEHHIRASPIAIITIRLRFFYPRT